LLLLTVVYAVLGWGVGMAINHAADILPKRTSLLRWPTCSNCGARRPYRGWSALTGRECERCRQRLPVRLRPVLVELVMPVFFVFLLWRYGLSLHLAIFSLYTAILILITITDLEHRLIFNVVILPSILMALAAAFFTPSLYWPSALVGGAAGFILSYLAALLSRGGFGEGDVTLSTFLGLIIGFPNILLSLGFGVFLGGFVAFFLLITRRVGLRSFIPYGPFLTITGWIMLVWGAEIWQYYFW
jgi:prepilin signal peptidase PulO-like enzyme (type II secretory pathway)